jgi:hypothetical protein
VVTGQDGRVTGTVDVQGQDAGDLRRPPLGWSTGRLRDHEIRGRLTDGDADGRAVALDREGHAEDALRRGPAVTRRREPLEEADAAVQRERAGHRDLDGRHGRSLRPAYDGTAPI